ncbi:MAG: extracellular solute-binding protein [Candidatus Omnitrophica bacterium]|nr:extracellular solute-binding protein [Candidatus Omnitrophota bacterium]
MKTINRIFCLCLCLLVTAGLLSSCAQKEEDPNTVVMWHWLTDRQSVLQELADRYKDETGITVKMELFAPTAYSQRIIASAQAKVLPDIYGILDKKQTFASFIDSGYVAELTEEFEKDNGAWEKSLFEKAINVNRFEEGNVYDVKPGIYGVPVDVTNTQMLYNKKLLAKAGIAKAPETMDEFLVAIEALKRVGISGLVSGWGESWMAGAFASNYAFNIMGEEKIMATYKGDVPYTDPDWIKVFRVFQRLSQAGAFIEGIVTKPNKFAEQDFALERAAFAYNGSWCVNVYHNMNPDLEYGVMLPPAVESDYPMLIWGGAGTSFVVNASSEKKQKAIDFLKWFTEKEQQAYFSKETRNLPANKEALASIPEVLEDFAKMMDRTTHPTIWKYNEDHVVSEKFEKGLQSIIIGEKTPEQVAQEVQEAKERVMKRQAR